MAVDLIALVSQYVTPQMIGQIAGMAGLDPTTAEELARRGYCSDRGLPRWRKRRRQTRAGACRKSPTPFPTPIPMY